MIKGVKERTWVEQTLFLFWPILDDNIQMRYFFGDFRTLCQCAKKCVTLICRLINVSVSTLYIFEQTDNTNEAIS